MYTIKYAVSNQHDNLYGKQSIKNSWTKLLHILRLELETLWFLDRKQVFPAHRPKALDWFWSFKGVNDFYPIIT